MQVLDALPACACLIDEGEIHLNRATESVIGFDRSEFSSPTDFVARTKTSPSDLFQLDPAVPRPGRFSLSSKDGRRISFELSSSFAGDRRVLCYLKELSVQANPVRQPNADPSATVTSPKCQECHDTAKRAEQKLAESEALLRAIIQSLPFDFFALDREGRYTMVNTPSIRFDVDMVGKSVPELAAGTPFEKHVPRWLETNARALAGETIRGECVFDRSGTQRLCTEIVAPIRDPRQKILGIFGIIIDITEQKLTQQALKESEERHRRFSGLTSDYVYCCTRRGNETFRIKWMGGAVQEITGYSEAEIFNSGCWTKFVHPADRERMAARLMELRPGERSIDEFRLVCKDGEICWIRQSARCEAGESEGEFHLFGASQNITESKNAEMALKNAEEIFRSFLEHSPAYLVFKDQNHRVLRLSRNFETVLGRPLDEVIGKSAGELYPPATAELIRQDDLRVLRDGRPTQREEEINGRFYSSFKFLIPQKDKPALLVAIKTDITARREAEDALCELNGKLDRRVAERTAQLEASILEQESFSYSVSHDLRAPLRHINSFSAILLEDFSEQVPAQARDYLRRICGATRRMGALIDNLLKLSRVSRTMVKRNLVNLSEVAAETALMLKEIEPERIVEFTIAPAIHAECDKALIRQLFENLIGNAWKYTANTGAARIEFGVDSSEKGAAYFVKDNGVGFNMLYKEKLFIPFQRLHGVEFEGDGIGLATVQRIVRGHGGSIWAEGAEGEGACFFFTLPS
jgi:PAS domain S-box-containing protein